MKLFRDPRSGYWHVRLKGSRPVSLRTKSEKMAKQFVKDAKLEEREAAAAFGLAAPKLMLGFTMPGTRATVSDVIEDWAHGLHLDGAKRRSIMAHVATVKKWARDLLIMNKPVATIDRTHLDSWINDPERETKYSTRLRNLAALTSFFKFACHQGLRGDNPAASISVRRDILSQRQLIPKVIQLISEEEYRKILASFQPGDFWHYATACAWHTGIRMTDIATMQWDSIRDDQIVLVTGKAGTIVRHTMPPELQQTIAAVRREHKLYLFPEQADMAERPGGQSLLSHQFRRHLTRLGIEGKHFHCLRHTYAVRKKQEEKHNIFLEMLKQLSDKNVMQALGHKQMASTKNYLKHEEK